VLSHFFKIFGGSLERLFLLILHLQALFPQDWSLLNWSSEDHSSSDLLVEVKHHANQLSEDWLLQYLASED
jgi:hypothetical protein